MKRGYLLLACLAFLLVGCNNKNDNGTELPDETPKIEINEQVLTQKWEDVIPVIDCSIDKEYSTLIPSVEAESFSAYWSIESNEESDLEIKFTSISCYGVRESYVTSTYEHDLQNNGFLISSSYQMGYQDVTYTTDLVVQYELVEDEESVHFDLIIYSVELRTESFPSDDIKSFLGFEIPEFKAKSYEYYASFGSNYEIQIDIYSYYCEEDAISNYVSKLQDLSYKISQKDGLYFAQRDDLMVDIIFYQYDETTCFLRVSSSWPYLYLIEILGNDLPKLDQEYSELSFKFISLNEDNECLCIYFDGTSQSSLDAYGTSLEGIGYELVDSSSATNQYTIFTNVYVINKDQDSEHMINLMYCVEQESLCIAVMY